MSKNRRKTVKNIEKRGKVANPLKNVEKPSKHHQKYRKIFKNVEKPSEKLQKF